MCFLSTFLTSSYQSAQTPLDWYIGILLFVDLVVPIFGCKEIKETLIYYDII